MKRIWKYGLKIAPTQIIMLPHGAKVLSAQLQKGVPVLWAEVDADHAGKSYEVFMIATGFDQVPEGAVFVDTLQFVDGGFVLHLYVRYG